MVKPSKTPIRRIDAITWFLVRNAPMFPAAGNLPSPSSDAPPQLAPRMTNTTTSVVEIFTQDLVDMP